MILFAPLLLAAQAATPPADPPAAVTSEIRVMAERLGHWRGRLDRRRGQFRCEIEQSSGDPALDEVRCNALRYCAMQIDSEVQALAGLDLSRSERDRRIGELTQGMAPCGEAYEDAVLTRIAWERAGQ